jgi:hypothetical protein
VVEHSDDNRKVGGSSPSLATKGFMLYRVSTIGQVRDSYLIHAKSREEAEELASHEFAVNHEGTDLTDVTAWEEPQK